MSKKRAKKEKEPVKDPKSDLFTTVLLGDPKNESLLLSYINGVFLDVGKTPIVQATVQNPFNIKKYAGDKGIVLDVRAKDEYGRFFNLEIQNRYHESFDNRILYSWSDQYSSQLKAGVQYTELRPVISIVLTQFTLFPQLKNRHNVFRITAQENPDVVLTDDFEMHFLHLSGIAKSRIDKLEGIRSELRHWLYFFVYGDKLSEAKMSSITNNDPAIMEAFEQLNRFYADPELMELDRQRRLATFDQMAANAAEAKGQARTIITILNGRYNATPENISIKLFALRDIEQLDRLATFALHCNSLEEFASHLH
jgi:predicted transposase/invertase (TIGR01784 family)